MVLEILDETGLAPHFLELEITEAVLIALSPQHRDMILRLRRIGVKVSLDDFGAGNSSLNYLKRFGVDRIKISQEFIAELTTNAEAAIIVKTILGLSRELGNDAIAKGVETKAQLHLLQSLACPDVQGFYVSAPLTAEAIAPLLFPTCRRRSARSPRFCRRHYPTRSASSRPPERATAKRAPGAVGRNARAFARCTPARHVCRGVAEKTRLLTGG
ncbi:MAG TPA: EAL domain-containing protein [Caulobacterales bacterium]|nr:EAL domain-containing protein [Caulobacterales bacterium]